MLTLIQIITRMIFVLEYTEDEVRECFESVVRGEYSLELMCDSINIEMPSPTMLAMAKEKLPKWESALFVVKSRSESETV